MMPWFSPAALDREHWRWRGMRRQKGGWDQPLWIVLQETWRKAVTAWFAEDGYE